MTEPTKSGHKTLGIKLPNGLHAQLDLIAKVEGITLGTALLNAAELYVETRRSAPDFAARAEGVIAAAEAEATAARQAVNALLHPKGNDAAPTAEPAKGQVRRRGEPTA
jgi:hypothetical protein